MVGGTPSVFVAAPPAKEEEDPRWGLAFSLTLFHVNTAYVNEAWRC